MENRVDRRRRYRHPLHPRTFTTYARRIDHQFVQCNICRPRITASKCCQHMGAKPLPSTRRFRQDNLPSSGKRVGRRPQYLSRERLGDVFQDRSPCDRIRGKSRLAYITLGLFAHRPARSRAGVIRVRISLCLYVDGDLTDARLQISAKRRQR